MPAPRIRFVLIGDGPEALAFLTAAEAAPNAVVTALVCDDPGRADTLARRFGIHLTKTHAELDRLLGSEAVDAVFVADGTEVETVVPALAEARDVQAFAEQMLATSVVAKAGMR